MKTRTFLQGLTDRFPLLALTLLSLLPFYVWAEAAGSRDERDHAADDVDYSAVEVQSQSRVAVSSLGNADLQALAADIRNRDGAASQRRANDLWLRNRAKNKPLTGGRAASKFMHAAVASAWKQWRESKPDSHDYLPDSSGRYAIAKDAGVDYQLGLDINAMHVDITVGASTAYEIRLDNNSARITYEYRF